MTPYRDTNRDSGIAAYEYGDDWIRIRFKDNHVYEYRAARIGQRHINAMIRLANQGNGLNAYINDNHAVRDGYSSKR